MPDTAHAPIVSPPDASTCDGSRRDRQPSPRIDEACPRSAAARFRRRRAFGVLAAGISTLVLLTLLSLSMGAGDLTLSQTWRGLTSLGDARDSREAIIVWQLRLPRVFLAVAVGCALAAAGVIMQALTRNPLAEPGLLGVNSGAAFAVVLAISAAGVTGAGSYVWFSFLGSATAACFVYVASIHRARRADHAHLVLAGTALSASLSAGTGIVTMFDTDAFSSYRFWVIGSVADRGYEILVPLLPFLGLGLILAMACGPALNVLALGDEQARALGARLAATRGLALASVTLLCGTATAAAGPIGFVGLAIPHLLRLLVGVDQRTVLALSLLIGPSFVLAADTLGRVLVPGELEVGIVCAFLGAPVLLAALARKRTSR